jgi:hypothetical protein
VLHAEANVLSALRSSDEQYGRWCVNFEKLSPDAGPQTKSIIFERGDGGPLDIRVLGIERARGQWEALTPGSVQAVVRMLEPGEKCAVDITVQPPWRSACVRLATGVPEQPKDEIDCYVTLESRLTFRCDPPKVPRVRTTPFQMKVWPQWPSGRAPGRLLWVDTAVPGLQARVMEEGGEEFVLVEVAPDCTPPTYWSWHTVTLRTDDPAFPEEQMPVPFDWN